MSKKSPQNARRGKVLGPVYKRIKSIMKNDEEVALQSILEKHPKERKKNLVAQHTEKTFVWKAKTNLY